MATIQRMIHCHACNKPTMHMARGVNHILHLILSLVTFGLWALFVWPWVYIFREREKCSVCGKMKGMLQ